jgi:hypothetical protein
MVAKDRLLRLPITYDTAINDPRTNATACWVIPRFGGGSGIAKDFRPKAQPDWIGYGHDFSTAWRKSVQMALITG